jgi:fibro-slime domain-containing protein
VFKKILLLAVLAIALTAGTANADLTGYYYNLPSTHPDMERWITGVTPGMVENTLTGSTPTLTNPYGMSQVIQWDWWDPSYLNFMRIDSDADLNSAFTPNWFPTVDGLPGDPYDFAVHWTGSFYVAAEMTYNYQMGSDDDSWLFIDNNLELDLGGVHAFAMTADDVYLTAGWHDIDIFFAERHVSASGFSLNFFTDLEPTPTIPEPATLLLFGLGMAGLGIRRFVKR